MKRLLLTTTISCCVLFIGCKKDTPSDEPIPPFTTGERAGSNYVDFNPDLVFQQSDTVDGSYLEKSPLDFDKDGVDDIEIIFSGFYDTQFWADNYFQNSIKTLGSYQVACSSELFPDTIRSGERIDESLNWVSSDEEFILNYNMIAGNWIKDEAEYFLVLNDSITNKKTWIRIRYDWTSTLTILDAATEK